MLFVVVGGGDRHIPAAIGAIGGVVLHDVIMVGGENETFLMHNARNI